MYLKAEVGRTYRKNERYPRCRGATTPTINSLQDISAGDQQTFHYCTGTMGSSKGKITVNNQTGSTWTGCIEFNEEIVTRFTAEGYNKNCGKPWSDDLSPGKHFLKLKCSPCTEQHCRDKPDLWSVFNPEDNPYFTIKKSNDNRGTHLHCNKNYAEKKSSCTNNG